MKLQRICYIVLTIAAAVFILKSCASVSNEWWDKIEPQRSAKIPEFEELKSKMTVEQLTSFATDIYAYLVSHGKFPDTLRDTGTIIQNDGWGHIYVYENHGSSFVLGSVGPDGVRGTEDDIIVDTNKK